MSRWFEDAKVDPKKHWNGWAARPKGKGMALNNYMSAGVFAFAALVVAIQPMT